MSRKAFTATVVAATIAWSIGLASLVAPLTARAAVTPGSLVKASLPAVYYVGADGKRYVFPNEKTYKTWYADFSGVVKITDAELAALQIGGNATYRPGVKMVKITTDPKVYAVDKGGKLRWVTSESLAVALYGANWNKMVEDVPDAYFTNYTVGADVNSTTDFNATTVQAAAPDINSDKSLSTVSGALTVAAALDNPAAATIISDGVAGVAGSQAFIDVLKLKFSSAPGTSANVNSLKLTRTGVSNDADIDNAYLFDGNTKIAEMASLSTGVLTFTGSPLFTVSGDKTLTVKFDLNRDSTAGKTVGLSLLSASDVVVDGGAAVSGTPVAGNLMTVAAVTDFGRLTLAAVATAATVDPATANFEAFRFTLTAANQNVKVTKLRMKMLGSINTTDLADVQLMDGGTQVGPTAQLDADKYVTFDLSSSPLLISSGVVKTMSLRVNVKGGATRNIQFSFQKAVDLMAMDGAYNVGLKPDTGVIGVFGVTNSTLAAVNPGNMTVTLSTTAPSGNVALNATNVQIAKYDLKAIGEAIKVSAVDFQVTSVGPEGAFVGAHAVAGGACGGTCAWTGIRNVRLVYNGVQVGTTQTSVAEDTNVSVSTNFTVAAGTTGTLEVRSDIASPAGASTPIANGLTIQARLNVSGANNAQRADSLGTFFAPAGATPANALVVAAGALATARNTSFGNQTVVRSTAGAKLGSWLLTAGSAEGVNVTSIVVRDNQAGAGIGNGTQSVGSAFTNLMLKKSDGTQLGQTIVTNPGDAVGTLYTFNISPALSLDASQALQVDLFGDALSGGAWNATDTTRIDSVTGTGKVTSSAANGAAAQGQQLTLQNAGTLSLSLDSSSPIATQLVMGATGATLGTWKFTSNNIEDITVSQIIVSNQNAAGNANVKNLRLYVGGSPVGLVVPAFDGANNATFSNLSILVPRAGDKQVTLKGDMTTFTDGSAAGVFVRPQMALVTPITGVGANTVIARGASGQFATTVATNVNGNDQYAFRTSLTASIACSGSCTGRVRAASDIIGKLSLTGTSSGDAQFRPARQANDEAIGTWTAVDADNLPAVNATAGQFVDGAGGIQSVSAANAASSLVVDMGATPGLNGYSRLSLWLNPSVNAGAPAFNLVIADDAALTTNVKTLVIAPTLGQLDYVDVNLLAGWTGGAPLASSRFVGVQAGTAGVGNTTTMTIDNVRFYTDSINLNLSGNLGAVATTKGLAINLRDSGGTVRGIGYVNSTSTTAATAVIVMGNDIGNAAASAPAAGLVSLGGTAQVFDLVTNTTTLMAADTANVESLSLSENLGTSAGAGDFSWWDQAVTSTTPVTWMNGTSPISVSLGY